MDSWLRIGETTAYQGGTPRQHNGGTGRFAQKQRDEGQRRQREYEPEPASDQAPPDPLLAEIDRLRALEPTRGDSGARRALRARLAYARHQDLPLSPPITSDAASSETTTAVWKQPAPPAAPPGVPPASP
ncbi:MAG: hypothetical protein RMM29_01755 [Planctomycetota bacterium]|nr:hypothetical protein [Planctomycetota bacterium]MCX8040554.1 hypothetical protein [Planctomycetota bacterium]MDW8372361.1 hypothetical protein [Planctomycetota bacterium]